MEAEFLSEGPECRCGDPKSDHRVDEQGSFCAAPYCRCDAYEMA